MCFSMEWIAHLLIWAVIIIAIIAILRLIIPWVLSQLGTGGGIVMQIVNILFWAIIAIFVIYIAFAVIGCLMSMGGGLSVMPHPR